MTATERLREYLAAYQRWGISARKLCRDNGLHERFLYSLTDGSSVRQWRQAVGALGISFSIFFGDFDPEKIVEELVKREGIDE